MWNQNNFWNHLVSVCIFVLVIPYIEALNLMIMCFECMDLLYPHIQRLVVELISYALTDFITEICFVNFLCLVQHISPLYIWIIWHKRKFVIKYYMVSNHINLYLYLLIWRIWHRELAHNVRRSILHYCP